tara:strand:+ start:183 stop:770 length:588 start_codon:yes stop_codon:yes gene_type:complete
MRAIFPTIIHDINIPNFNRVQHDLIKFSYEEKKKDPVGNVKSNLGGWQSKGVYQRDNNILLKTVSDNLFSYFSQDVLDMSKEIILNDLWININKKGDSNVPHDHPLSDMAGVLWIKTSKDSGNIEFSSPHHFTCGSEIERYTPKFKEKINVYDTYWLSPVEGRILVFPSSLVHRVIPNESMEDRISASFNLKFVL